MVGIRNWSFPERVKVTGFPESPYGTLRKAGINKMNLTFNSGQELLYLV
jgi:hypothetical protein